MNADGSNQHLLLAEPGFSEERASFSPDGSALVLTRCKVGLPGVDTCPVYRINVDGTALTRITRPQDDVPDRGPVYSPDGKTIAFGSNDRDGIIGAIYLVDADGSNDPNRITPTAISGVRPDWSPDGRKIAFRTHCCNPHNETIAVISPDGTGLRELTHNGSNYNGGPHDLNPSWSPQGDAIVFDRDAPDFSSSAIFVMKANGSGLTRALVLSTSKVGARPLIRERNFIGHPNKGNRIHQIEEGGSLPRWGAAPN
jgi:Tol biopolymer transport system component